VAGRQRTAIKQNNQTNGEASLILSNQRRARHTILIYKTNEDRALNFEFVTRDTVVFVYFSS